MDERDPIEIDLADLTQWSGGTTRLWRAALKARKAGERRGVNGGFSALLQAFAGPRRRLALTGAAAAVLLMAVGVNMMMSSVGLPAANRWIDQENANTQGMGPRQSLSASNLNGIGHAMYIYAEDDPGVFPNVDLWSVDRQNNKAPKQFNVPSRSGFLDPANDTTAFPDFASGSGGRFVIQSANLSLSSADVSAAFFKLQHLTHPETGEYVERSALRGTGKDAYAEITLRVAAGRLSEALNEIRGIGKVESEQSGGRDVTTEVVDVESRLRNERRVEVELLELFDKRKDAPLADVMALRDSIQKVRESIESLTGRRETLGKLVSLASIVIILRSDATPPPAPEPTTFSKYFSEGVAGAWRQGVWFLADAAAFCVRVIVGGAPFWILVAMIIVIVKRKIRRDAGT